MLLYIHYAKYKKKEKAISGVPFFLILFFSVNSRRNILDGIAALSISLRYAVDFFSRYGYFILRSINFIGRI